MIHEEFPTFHTLQPKLVTRGKVYDYTNYTSHNTATHNIHTVTRYGSKVTYIKGPFIYYVSTCKWEGGGQKVGIFAYFQY